MNIETLKLARQRVPGVAVLINMVSKRVRQLCKGHKPLVKPLSNYEDKEDIALREIAEGKIVAEIDFAASEEENNIDSQVESGTPDETLSED